MPQNNSEGEPRPGNEKLAQRENYGQNQNNTEQAERRPNWIGRISDRVRRNLENSLRNLRNPIPSREQSSSSQTAVTQNNQTDFNEEEPKNAPPMPVSLCLVVPARRVNKDRLLVPLDASLVKELIGNASYFLCTTPEEADQCEKDLPLMINENNSPESQREVYIRIDISDGGQELLDQKLRYILERELPTDTNVEFTSQKIADLKYLSGLQKFNRV